MTISNDEFKALTAQLEARDSELKGLIEKANEEARNAGAVSSDTKAAIEGITASQAETHARLLAMEQAIAGRADEQTGGKTVGQMFAESDQFKALVQAGRGSAKMGFTGFNAAVTSITSATTGTGGAGDGIRADRLAGIVTPPERKLTVRSLLMPGRTSSNAVEFVKESGFQNMAAPQVEGATKAQSDLSLDLVTTNVRTLAHFFRASKQVLDDIPLLASYIDTRSRYGLKDVEDQQLLAGDGTGQNLLGIVPQATAFSNALRVAEDTEIDTIRRAKLQVRIARYEASAIVLNPVDWAKIETLKDTNGRYIIGDPTGERPQRLWNLPVVDSDAIAEGHFLIGAFDRAAQVFDREDANVQVSTEDGDNFTKNMVTIRAEERLALAVHRPESFVYGPFEQG
ncbi:Phage capsid family protein [compost metagenome]